MKSRDTDVYEIIPVHGVGVELHVEHDGEPVPPDVRRKQEQRLAERRREIPAQAAQRLAREKHDRAFYNEIPDAFDFRIAGEERLPTGPAWVVKATPRPGFQPRSRYAHGFPHMRGTLWIDQQDAQWVKADAKGSSRTFLLFGHNFEQDITYANFRKGENAVAAAR